MEDINKELDEKQIEKTEIEQVINEVAEETPKPKKPRSEAQKKAFEKARAKRMENLKLKEEQGKKEVVIAPDPQLAVQDKGVSFEEKPEPVIAPLKKKRGRPKGVKNKKVMKHQEPPPTPDRPYYPHPVDYPIPQAQPPQYAFQGGQVPLNPHAGTIGAPQQYIYQPPPQQAPVNNYYYYGTPPQQVANEEPDYAIVDSEEEVVEPVEVEEEEPPPPQQEEIYQPALRYRFV